MALPSDNEPFHSASVDGVTIVVSTKSRSSKLVAPLQTLRLSRDEDSAFDTIELAPPAWADRVRHNFAGRWWLELNTGRTLLIVFGESLCKQEIGWNKIKFIAFSGCELFVQLRHLVI